MENKVWTRDEMILVLNLYLKMPFGKMHRKNPDVIKTAHILGRTPDAVAYRLVNYASCDTQLKQRGISGMSHGGKKCEKYWNEFINDRDRLLFESEKILAQLEGTSIEIRYKKELYDIPQGLTGEAKICQVKTRINQTVFRQIILANYDYKCALTGIDIPELLVASHIIPWAKNSKERLNPENGICLSVLYDKAFDQGLIGFDKNGKVLFSERLAKNVGKEYFDRYFLPVSNKALSETKKYSANPDFLEWHRANIFNK
ncbi:HNH endonuclease [Fibrobacter intestinalis]|uniref:Putative restriction endonuclease n=1 Tax=Fibrobacter intestinalis TaxID=28122 RepID=A0A1T4REY7_9BACT|nr:MULTISPECIES: HNH endonuclease [Fibrobacter]PBC72505.1 putative restriction endonuclease [Fibrobacter sp. NR9]SKA14437.1 putative restriction endonuclease [Fibrobacter intestinalis]